MILERRGWKKLCFVVNSICSRVALLHPSLVPLESEKLRGGHMEIEAQRLTEGSHPSKCRTPGELQSW